MYRRIGLDHITVKHNAAFGFSIGLVLEGRGREPRQERHKKYIMIDALVTTT